MKVVIIGSRGFVGSAFVRNAEARGWKVISVNRENYAQMAGTTSDLVIEAACNSRKFFAEEQPFAEFDTSVGHRLRTLRDFPSERYLHLSSVDVYSDLSDRQNNRESASIDCRTSSFYGVHKRIAEQLVEKYAANWLILRLAGMVGPGLRKNPVHDILHDQPLRIHPDSRYQFMSTDEVARIALDLIEQNVTGEVFNLCGSGLISPRRIAELAGKSLGLTALPENVEPRIVDINNEKIATRFPVPTTESSVTSFLATRLATARLFPRA